MKPPSFRPIFGAVSASLLLAVAVLAADAEPAADVVALKKTRLVELQQRLQTDQDLSQDDRVNLEKLVACWQAELAPATSPTGQQSKLD
ncbi:hypothetical protein HQ590_16235 [bacterium]|nr:hypothetical protein [bacterium]